MQWLCWQTYNVDHQTPDSAGTGTAYLTGVKTNMGTIGVNAHAQRGVCSSSVGTHLTSILDWSHAKGSPVKKLCSLQWIWFVRAVGEIKFSPQVWIFFYFFFLTSRWFLCQNCNMSLENDGFRNRIFKTTSNVTASHIHPGLVSCECIGLKGAI